MGLAQGIALRDKITGAWECLRELDAFRLKQPWWLPYRLFSRMAAARVERLWVPALEATDPAALERLRGIADGAQLPLRCLCLLNAMEALLSSVRGLTRPTVPAGACSALAVRGTRSKAGEPVVARNFDYLPLVQPYFTMRITKPRNGYRSLDFVVAPQAGTVDGINERGLCITYNYAFMTEVGPPAPLTSMAIADALTHCKNVEEAIERIAERPRWGAGLLMLADASGDLACLELSNTRSAIRRPAPGEDFLAFTNVCQCPETVAVQVPGDSVFSEHVPPVLRGKPVLAWHEGRARRIEALVRARASLGPDDLAEIMADHGPTGRPDGSSPCVHTDYWRTTACLQWFPARRQARVSFTTGCEARYVDLALLA
jgi:hypothetical protein